MTARRDPPRRWLDVVRHLVPATRRDEITGDLVELWRLRADAGTRFLAVRFWRDVWSLVPWSSRRTPSPERRTRFTDALAADLRTALRGLRSNPATTTLAVAIFAVTIAAGTVTFSVVDAVAIRPLPYAAPDELISAMRQWRTSSTPSWATPQDFFTWQRSQHTLAGTAAAQRGPNASFDVAGTPRRAGMARVTANLFDVLGVHAALGRTFVAGDDEAGRDRLAVLSHALWMREFAGDPTIVGRMLTISTVSRQVVGILPPDVTFPISATGSTDVFVRRSQFSRTRTSGVSPPIAASTPESWRSSGRSRFSSARLASTAR